MLCRKAISWMLAMALVLAVMTGSARAADGIGFHVDLSSSVVQIGDTVCVTVSLTGYTEEAAAAEAIRGVQVDITGIDPLILAVEEYDSLIEDPQAASNTASYNQKNQRVRLAYVKLDGSLQAPCEDVLRVVFRVREDLTEAGSIQLPVTVKIQTESQRITQTGTFTIQYTPEAPEVISIDIEWGSLDFAYDKGTWNARTHIYENGGWTDNGTGYITVTNSGNVDTSVTFTYETDRTDISGAFTDGSAAVASPVNLAAGQARQIHLVLSGAPSELLDKAEIGRVTVRIGGE